jgi:DNA-directed RNA polymerase subunit M/transcription elongation factor TFIIS
VFEFCDKCGSIMLPAKKREENLLICNLCDYEKRITTSIEDSYTFHKEIENTS